MNPHRTHFVEVGYLEVSNIGEWSSKFEIDHQFQVAIFEIVLINEF